MRMMSCPGKWRLGGESGQMAVELAVVLPVILVVMVIAIDCMVFVSESARFDHVAAQKTLAKAVSPTKKYYENKDRVKLVKKELSKEFDGYGEEVKVTSRKPNLLYAGIRVYDYELSMTPWPLGKAGGKLFGVKVPKLLKHKYSFAFAPYTPGKIL